MSLSPVEVDINALGRKIEDMGNAEKSFEGQINTLYEKILSLNAMWTGEAANAFQTKAKADYEQIKEQINEMKSLTQQYGEAKNCYAECEGKVAETIASIHV